MQFLFPGFLIAGLAIAVPILIHLFYFRRFKPVYFTNVRFLREIKEETSSRSRLRNLLVLLFRILTILFLVAAFAQPFLPKGETANQGPKAVGIYVDNSFSMGALSRDVSLLEVAKTKALDIVDGYGESDRFQVLTNDYSGQEQRLVTREQARDLITAITPSPRVADLTTVVQRQSQVLGQDSGRRKVSYLLSDFQRATSEWNGQADTSMTIHALPLQAVQEQNMAIDSAWFEGPVLIAHQANPLVIQVRNTGNEAVEQVRLSIFENGQEKPIGQLSIPPGGQVKDTLYYTPQVAGWQNLELRVTDYPVQFDDAYYLAIQVRERINVLAIYHGRMTPYLDRGLSGLAAFQPTFQSDSQIDYSRFADYQLIILNDLPALSSGLVAELAGYLAQGGNVLVFPGGAQTELNGYAELAARTNTRRYGSWDNTPREASEINTRSFVFQDVYTNARANLRLPSSRGNYRLDPGSPVNEEILIRYRDGQNLLARYPVELGNLYLCSVPLDSEWSDLGKTGEVFIPMVYKMALSGRSVQKIAYTLGLDQEIELSVPVRRTSENIIRMQSGESEFVPAQRFIGSRVKLGIHHGLEQAGIYDVKDEQSALLGKVAVNFDRRESDLAVLSPEQIMDLGFLVPDETARADLSIWVGEQERGVVLWRWCVILALICIAIESLLLRFWKT